MNADRSRSGRRRALVTGGGGGIGRELCRGLLERAYQVIAVGAHQEELDRLREAFPAVETELVDLTTPDACAALDARHGDAVDLLVNCAGVGLWGSHVGLDVARIHAMVALNVAALTDLSARFGKRMRARAEDEGGGVRGAILNVASTASFHPCPYLAAYAATKHYVVAFTLALADELRPHGVDVAVLCPGITRTPFLARVGVDDEMPIARAIRALSLSPEEVADEGLARFFAGQTRIVPGRMNRAHAALSSAMSHATASRLFARVGAREGQGRAEPVPR